MSDFQNARRQEESNTAAVAHTVQEKASESASLVGSKAAEVGGTAKDQAANVVGEATAQARDLVGELRTQLTDQAQTQTQRLAENVRRLSQELRELGENGKPDSTMADVARQIADGGHQIAAHVEKRGPDGLVGDLQSFARRRPGVFLAGAALAGFVVARAGKSVSAAGSAGTPSAAHDDSAGAPSPTPPPAPSGDAAPVAGSHPGRTGVPVGVADPLGTYGQSERPQVTPAPPAYPPTSEPPTSGVSRPGGGI
ncbi:hypothetical protein ACFV0H_01730 [Streptomyces erythrochromogenes]|uniref:DUF3618 domain-containing protein n=1 Tax=Streptomyces erythrochromogenes TaxID=285574 RepID=A0ABZ1Q646_9ACTN|nr:hypothetical protein [Streptomyces erythrochromogenes]MCX5583225.1 hypothetical protein [Streptomyces erythrochromogenes]